MRGDKIIVEKHHISAARQLAQLLVPSIEVNPDTFILTIAGESGAGKSECAVALSDELAQREIRSLILQQDDYFVYPPKTNAAMRRKDIAHVGPSEVQLALLDRNLGEIVEGSSMITKPLVNFDQDSIDEDTLDLTGIRAVIVEGTYTTLLENVHNRIFIDRSYLDTSDARKRRARERQDDHLAQILEIEHAIISTHRDRADILITRDYDVVEYIR